MKLLWVKAGKILPVDTGGRIRSYHILRSLAVREQVTFISYYGGKRDVEYEATLKDKIPGAVTIYTAAPDTTALERQVDYLRRLPQSAPYAVSKFTHQLAQKAVASWFSDQGGEVAVCDFLSASLNFPERLSKPTVLFQHNVESSLWRRLATTEGNPVKKILYKIEAGKMERYERRALKRFQHVIAVSEVDRQQMLAMHSGCPITVVPTGVDCAEFSVAPPASIKPPRIVFIGSMDWEPNIDAVIFFARDIWPSVQARFPDAVFEIVGRNPDPKVRGLASPSIKVSGTVPSIVPHVKDATVVVVPLRIGGGTRLKIFEAMAMGKAVVSTSIGAEGLDVTSGRNLVLADDARTFADAVLLVLCDPALRRRYEEAAAQQASKYDWPQIAQRFLAVLQQAASAHESPQATSDSTPIHS
jgi:glycosyltransferase involved in cell wall biosynthesis